MSRRRPVSGNTQDLSQWLGKGPGVQPWAESTPGKAGQSKHFETLLIFEGSMTVGYM